MRKNAQLILGLVVSVVALALAFRGANLGVMAGALRKANYFLLGVGIVLYFVGLIARAGCWSVILGKRVRYWRVFDALNEGYLLNYVLPFRLGEFGRAYLVSRRNDLPVLEALSSIVVERVIDLMMVVILLLVFLPLVAGLGQERSQIFWTVGVSAVAILVLVIVARHPDSISRLVGAVLRKLKLRWLNADRWEARTASFLAGLSAVRDPKRAIAACLFSFGAWAAAGFGAWAILGAFLPSAGITMSFVTLALVGIGGAVPSAPGSAGIFEFVVVQSLGSIFGVDKSLALSFALVLHAVNFVLAIVLGGLALAREGETLAHLARAAQSLVTNSRSLDKNTRETAAPEQ